MQKTSFVALALLGAVKASASADESWATDLAGCNSFAGNFANTCSSAAAFGSIPTESVTCSNVGACAGTTSGSDCTWNRKLCVTCRDDAGTVKIRVQTNGLPDHCYKSPQTAPAEQTFDFEVKWLSAASANSAAQPNNQRDLNVLLCDSLTTPRQSNIPSSAGFSLQGGASDQSTAWGVSTTGVLIFSALSGENVDPFYPAVYADVTDPDSVIEKVDWCLAHPQVTGIFHYHVASTCNVDASTTSTYLAKSPPMNDDVKTVVKSAWMAKPYISALGIAKDGRPILSPLKNNGQDWDDCEVDVCNGVTVGGSYMYASTLFHPYFMGCYGTGSAPELYQQCSSNPRLCNVVYEGAMANSVSLVLAGATVLYMTLF